MASALPRWQKSRLHEIAAGHDAAKPKFLENFASDKEPDSFCQYPGFKAVSSNAIVLTDIVALAKSSFAPAQSGIILEAPVRPMPVPGLGRGRERREAMRTRHTLTNVAHLSRVTLLAALLAGVALALGPVSTARVAIEHAAALTGEAFVGTKALRWLP